MKTLDSILREPVPTKFYKIIGVLIGLAFLSCLILFVSIRIFNMISERQIQQALDEDCGENKVSVQNGYFTYDPEFRWDSGNASCYEDIISKEFVCSCPSSP